MPKAILPIEYISTVVIDTELPDLRLSGGRLQMPVFSFGIINFPSAFASGSESVKLRCTICPLRVSCIQPTIRIALEACRLDGEEYRARIEYYLLIEYRPTVVSF